MTERQFQAWIAVRARERGWRLQFHVLRAQVEGRWVTNTSSRGVPDLWLLRPTTGQLVVLEVKKWGGRPTPEQNEWIAALQQVPGVEAYLVSPRDAEQVLELLGPPDHLTELSGPDTVGVPDREDHRLD